MSNKLTDSPIYKMLAESSAPYRSGPVTADLQRRRRSWTTTYTDDDIIEILAIANSPLHALKVLAKAPDLPPAELVKDVVHRAQQETDLVVSALWYGTLLPFCAGNTGTTQEDQTEALLCYARAASLFCVVPDEHSLPDHTQTTKLLKALAGAKLGASEEAQLFFEIAKRTTDASPITEHETRERYYYYRTLLVLVFNFVTSLQHADGLSPHRVAKTKRRARVRSATTFAIKLHNQLLASSQNALAANLRFKRDAYILLADEPVCQELFCAIEAITSPLHSPIARALYSASPPDRILKDYFDSIKDLPRQQQEIIFALLSTFESDFATLVTTSKKLLHND